MTQRARCAQFLNIYDGAQYLRGQKVTRSKFHTADLQILGATVQKLFAMATWRPVSVHPYNMHIMQAKILSSNCLTCTKYSLVTLVTYGRISKVWENFSSEFSTP